MNLILLILIFLLIIYFCVIKIPNTRDFYENDYYPWVLIEINKCKKYVDSIANRLEETDGINLYPFCGFVNRKIENVEDLTLFRLSFGMDRKSTVLYFFSVGVVMLQREGDYVGYFPTPLNEDTYQSIYKPMLEVIERELRKKGSRVNLRMADGIRTWSETYARNPILAKYDMQSDALSSYQNYRKRLKNRKMA